MAHTINNQTYSSVLGGDEVNTVDMIKYTRVGTGTCPRGSKTRGVDRCELPRATHHEHDITRYRPVETASTPLFPDSVQPFRDPSHAPISRV